MEDATEYIVAHQWGDGWLGPEAPADRDLWARFPLFLGLIQLVEADITQANRVVPAMYTFIELMHSMLVENTGLTQIWGRVRFPDMLISLQWLYESYPLGNQAMLLDTMSLLESRGFDWPSYWTKENFIFVDLDTIQDAIGGDSQQFPFVHGVNAAQGLKAGATIYRFTGNDSILQNNRNGVNWTFSYHGDPAGSIIGDERESGLNANRGTYFSEQSSRFQYQISVTIRVSGGRSLDLFLRYLCRVDVLLERENADFAIFDRLRAMYRGRDDVFDVLLVSYFGRQRLRGSMRTCDFQRAAGQHNSRPLGSSISCCG